MGWARTAVSSILTRPSCTLRKLFMHHDPTNKLLLAPEYRNLETGQLIFAAFLADSWRKIAIKDVGTQSSRTVVKENRNSNMCNTTS